MKKAIFIGLLIGMFSLGVVSAFIIDEWFNETILKLGDDSFVVSHHRYANSQTGEDYKEFVLKSIFGFETEHTMKFRNDGTFWIDDKAVCFKDGTSSDGGRCLAVQIAKMPSK